MTAIKAEHGESGGVASRQDESGALDPGTRRRRRRKVALATVLLVAVAAMSLGGVLLHIQAQLDGQIVRIEHVFRGVEDRPAKPTSGSAKDSVNILVMGTDRRGTVGTTGTSAVAPEWIPGAQRTDTIMILHVDGDRKSASLVSIPRDSWVDVPAFGFNKINAAFSYAGPSLAVQTVEDLTGIRIDHLAVIDWIGFQALTDAVGGVRITVPRTIADTHNNVVWTKGTQRLDGRQALLYVRQRYGLPGGDFDRVQRQQVFVRSLMRSTLASMRSNHPGDIHDVLDTLTSNLSVDAEWSSSELRGLLLDLRSMSAADVHFLTAPVTGTGMEGSQSVVYLDQPLNQSLWSAVRDDGVEQWLASHTTDVVTGPVD